MYIDKRKSIKNKYRIKEKTLLLISFYGGSIGSLIAMYMFRHKVLKAKFFIGIPFILILEIILMIYLYYIYYGKQF